MKIQYISLHYKFMLDTLIEMFLGCINEMSSNFVNNASILAVFRVNLNSSYPNFSRAIQNFAEFSKYYTSNNINMYRVQ